MLCHLPFLGYHFSFFTSKHGHCFVHSIGSTSPLLFIPELGNTPLEKLTTIQIQKFYNDLQKSGRIQRYTHIKLKDKGLSTRAVLGIHTLLNNCLEQAVAERLLLTNPAKGCRLPKLKKAGSLCPTPGHSAPLTWAADGWKTTGENSSAPATV